MKKYLLLLAISIYSFQGYAQDIYLPFLKNGHYGVVTSDGKTIIEAQYDEVFISQEHYMILARKGELWGIFDLEGNSLFPLTIPHAKAFDYEGPSVYLAFSDKDDASFKYTRLKKIKDVKNNKFYYINPYQPLDKYEPYAPYSSYVKKSNRPWWFEHVEEKTLGILRVKKADNQTNFIDTTGREILPEAVHEALPLDKSRLAIDDGNKKYALGDFEGNVYTNHLYDNITSTPLPGFYLTYTRTASNLEFYHLINSEGEQILESEGVLEISEDGYIIMKKDQVSYLLQSFNDTLRAYPGCDLSFINKFDGALKLDCGEGQIGIVNIEGDTLLKPVYDYLEELPHNNKLQFKTAQHVGLLDGHLKEIFAVSRDSIEEIKSVVNLAGEKRYKCRKGSNIKWYYGLMDTLGNILTPVHYDKFMYSNKCRELIIVNKGLHNGLINANGEEVLPCKYKFFTFLCDKDEVYANSGARKWKYNLKGELAPEYTLEGKPRLNFGLSNKELDTGRRIYIKRKEDKNFYDVLNDDGISILPKGYALAKKHRTGEPGVNGSIIVVYKNDFINRDLWDETLRGSMGLIDTDGNWLIPPAQQYIRKISYSLYVIYATEQSKSGLYDRFGKKVNDTAYKMIKYYGNDPILNNRILVQSGQQYGYIDSTGQEVIPLQYIVAEPFNHQYTTVSGLDKQGETYAAVIDLDGNPILMTEYSQLTISAIDSTLLIAKKGDKEGMIDLNGEVIISPEYKRAWKSEIPNVYIAQTNDKTFALYENGNKIEIGANSGKTKVHQLDEQIYYTSTPRGWERDKHFFDGNGNYIRAFKEHRAIKKLAHNPLPEGYIAITQYKTSKPYVVDFLTGKEYR